MSDSLEQDICAISSEYLMISSNSFEQIKRNTRASVRLSQHFVAHKSRTVMCSEWFRWGSITEQARHNNDALLKCPFCVLVLSNEMKRWSYHSRQHSVLECQNCYPILLGKEKKKLCKDDPILGFYNPPIISPGALAYLLSV